MATPHSEVERDVETSGYESPTEANQPPFFTPSNAGTPAIERTASDVPPTRPPPPTRPSGLPRMGRQHMSAATAPPALKGRADDSNGSNLNDILANSDRKLPNEKVSIKDRIACHQWTWFAMTMATGGIANVLSSLSFRSAWLDGVGVTFFLFNVLLFIMNCILISIRFHLRPGTFIATFTDQTESLFIPSFFVSITVIMINTCQYGVPHVGSWLLRTMEVMFWINSALSVMASATIYLILWSTLVFPIHMMTPVWVFPAYPLLLNGPFAGNLIGSAIASGHEVQINTKAVAFCAIATQGAGCLIAFMISAAFIYRLMTQKLPRDMQRPGVFISIGPYAFTVAGIVQLGSQSEYIIPQDFMGADQAVAIVKIIAIMVGLWLWGLSLWFFLVSVGSFWKYFKPDRKMPFQMTWYSFVFPNTALITATEAMGKALDSDGIKVMSCVMAGCLVIVWAAVFYTMLRCLKHRQLLWPKDDK